MNSRRVPSRMLSVDYDLPLDMGNEPRGDPAGSRIEQTLFDAYFG